MIADPGDETRGIDLARERLGRARSRASGFSTKNGSPLRSAARSGAPWAKGGTQM